MRNDRPGLEILQFQNDGDDHDDGRDDEEEDEATLRALLVPPKFKNGEVENALAAAAAAAEVVVAAREYCRRMTPPEEEDEEDATTRRTAERVKIMFFFLENRFWSCCLGDRPLSLCFGFVCLCVRVERDNAKTESRRIEYGSIERQMLKKMKCSAMELFGCVVDTPCCCCCCCRRRRRRWLRSLHFTVNCRIGGLLLCFANLMMMSLQFSFLLFPLSGQKTTLRSKNKNKMFSTISVMAHG